jgi:hypothetical protein
VGKELEVLDRVEQMNAVVEQYLKGEKPTQIAKKLQMKRSDVLDYIDEYKEIARNDPHVKGRAREALYSADSHFSMVIERSWETVEQADQNNDIRTKATVLKNIADIEGKRVEMLQKAGLYDDAAIGDELAAMEEKAEAIKQLLKEVATKYPEARYMIMSGLSKIFGQPEGVVIDAE